MARTRSPSTAALRSPPRSRTCMGKFARVALGTRHIDYNGRLCMVSAGTAYKLAFGVDRSPHSVERHSESAGGLRRSAPTSASARPSRPTTSGAAATTAAS